MRKRILSLILALTLCVSLLPIAALASEEPEVPALEEAPPEAEAPIEEPAEEPAEEAHGEMEEPAEAEAPAEPEHTAAEDAANAAVASGTCGENLTWSLDEDGTLTISGEGGMYNYYDTKGEEPPWYEQRKNVTAVVIEQGVTRIGVCAFRYCSLTNITIPDSVTNIGREAFFRCESLTSVTIPASIDVNTFYGCTSLTSVIIGRNAKVIGEQAFRECTSLKSVTIPDSVTNIGSAAFCDCESLTSLIIGNSVTSIEGWAFYGCGSLTSLTIGNSVTSIGNGAFSSCTSLTSVTIPDSVTSIGKEAFYSCGGLTSVTIPDSVTSIGVCAFSGCESLAEFEVDAGNAEYASEDGVLYSKDKTVLIEYPHGKADASFTIPDSVTSIGESAFFGCTALKGVTIPDSVTSIEGQAFYDCKSLASVTIPDSVTSIGASAFAYCESLTSVIIGNSVTSIEGQAFYDCKSLASVTIPDSVTSIGARAFEYCESLTGVTIGNSVTSIGVCAFSYCTSLTSVTIPDSVTSLDGEYAFSNCESLTSLTIGNSVTNIGRGVFYCCTSLTSVTIPDSVTSIETKAFDGGGGYDSSYNLKRIIFLGDAPKISAGAFTNVIARAYYYADADGWTDEVKQDYGGSLTWKVLSDKDLISTDGTAFATRTDGSAWDDGITLVVTPNPNVGLGTSKENAYEKQTAYEISLQKDGAAFQPNGAVLVRLAVPAGYDGARCVVLRAEENGTLTDMKAEYSDGMLQFTTDHFSRYYVAEKAAEDPGAGAVTDDDPSTGTDAGTGDGQSTNPGDVLLGDVNGDNTVNAKDVTVLFQYVNKQRDDLPNPAAANVNGDKDINAKDVTRLFQYANKQIDSLEK